MHHISCCTLIISLGTGCCRLCRSSYQPMCLKRGFPLEVQRGRYAHQLRHRNSALLRTLSFWCRLQLIRTEHGVFSVLANANVAPEPNLGTTASAEGAAEVVGPSYCCTVTAAEVWVRIPQIADDSLDVLEWSGGRLSCDAISCYRPGPTWPCCVCSSSRRRVWCIELAGQHTGEDLKHSGSRGGSLGPPWVNSVTAGDSLDA